jgi:hypothetical protein
VPFYLEYSLERSVCEASFSNQAGLNDHKNVEDPPDEHNLKERRLGDNPSYEAQLQLKQLSQPQQR